MAKNNLFLGTATKSVGDIVLMRRNGKQVARVRVRTIKNPRTEAQARQRMAFASVTRLYAPLASCLETSFEGKNKTDSYSAYLKENLKRARELAFAAPRGGAFIPMPVKLSSGTLPTADYAWNSEDDEGFNLEVAGLVGNYTIGEVSAAIQSCYGLADGDQVTFIYAIAGTERDTYNPRYARMFIDRTSPDPFVLSGLSVSSTNNVLSFTEENGRLSGFAVIFSRWENGKWRRSTQYMAVPDGWDRQFVGVEAQNIFLPDWMTESSVPVSDVYLNGATSAPINLTAWMVNAAGNGVGDSFKVVGARSVQYDNKSVLALVKEDGSAVPYMCLNTYNNKFKTIPSPDGAQNYDKLDADPYTIFCTFQDAGAKDTNGTAGANSILFLQTLGFSPQAAYEFGGWPNS